MEKKDLILVVEDEQDQLFIMEGILADHFDVLLAATADEAMLHFRARHQDVKLILLDFYIGDTFAFEVVEMMLRIQSPLPQILLVTAFSDQTDFISEKMRYTKVPYELLEKPYSVKQLLGTVKKKLAR